MSQLRRAMMRASRKSGSELPTGYTAFDWVQADSSTGKAAINTEFLINMPRNTTQHRYTIETAFARTEDFAVNWTGRFIVTNSNETYDMRVTLMKNGNKINQLRFRYQCTGNGEYGQITDYPINIGEWHHVVLTYQDEAVIGGKLILDNTTYLVETLTGNTTKKPLYLLGYTRNDEVYPCRMARTKIYDYGVLAADLVPAMRDADGVVGFYDVVRKMFCAPSIEGVQLLCGNGLENF